MSNVEAVSAKASPFGTVLKEWRAVRRMSQLELGSLAEVSPRHISFLESGRSNPSRPMVMHLTAVLEVPRQRSAGGTPPRTKPIFERRGLRSGFRIP